MTAIGFTMLWAGAIGTLWFYDQSLPVAAQTNKVTVVVMLTLAGLLTVLSGISAWLWEVMP
jgi:multisubunit Na+/H+ antiporter MnhG subunit